MSLEDKTLDFNSPSVSQITVPTALGGGKKNGTNVSISAPVISDQLNSSDVNSSHYISDHISSADEDKIDDDDEEDQDDYALGLSDDDKTLCCEVFEAGTHVDSSGAKATWSSSDIDDIVKKGNAQLSSKPIPITLGHPNDASPSYGWVEGLRKVGGKIRAKFNQLNTDFVTALKNGSYKGRSISLYDDNRIRHVGFLGAMQPSVEGLQPFSFEDKSPSKTYDFEELKMSEYDQKDVNFLFKLLKKFGVDVKNASKEKDMAEDKTVVTATKDHAETSGKTETIKQAEEGGQAVAPVTANDAELVAKETKDPGPEAIAKIETAKAKNAESEESTENTELKSTIAALISRIETLEGALAKNHSEAVATVTTAETKAVEAQAKVVELEKKIEQVAEQSLKNYVEDLVKAGQLRPADKEMTLMALEAQVILDKTPVYNMSENKDETTKVSRVDQYKAKLNAMPKIVQFGEFPNLPAAQSPASFPAPDVSTMGSYIESMCNTKMAEQDKLSLTTKTSYWENLKGAHAEAAKQFPAEYKEFVAKTMMPGMPGR